MIRSVATGVRIRAGRSDVLLVAAALTCYAVLGYVPLVAIGLRVAAGLLGRGDVVQTGTGIAGYLHGGLHMDRVVESLTRSASTMSWWYALAAVLPVSLFAEGTVRCLERFSLAPERHSRSIRGRLLAPVLVLVSIAASLLFTGAVRPLLFDPFGAGLGARLLGILVAFNILFFPILATLAVVYRLFATTPLRPFALLLGAGAASSWLASQTLAYVLVARWVSGIRHAFGGYQPAGVVAAIVFLTYLQNLVLLFGYLLALRLHEGPDEPAITSASGTDRGGVVAPGQRDQR